MALRGDASITFPARPGIGDKGSVDLIVRIRLSDAVLERSSEVKRKASRVVRTESGLRPFIKELVTIDCHVRSR